MNIKNLNKKKTIAPIMVDQVDLKLFKMEKVKFKNNNDINWENIALKNLILLNYLNKFYKKFLIKPRKGFNFFLN